MASATYRALLLGNATFDHSQLGPLNGPIKDLPLLAEALACQATGLFEQADVTPLPDLESGDMKVKISTFFDAGEQGDLLLLYYSGHGVLDVLGRLYLATKDIRDGAVMEATSVDAAFIHSRISRSQATAKVLILDCCYAGAFKGVGGLPWQLQGEGLFGLFSTDNLTKAKDTVCEGQPSPFTAALVEGLKSGAPRGDDHNFVKFDDVYFYLDEKLRSMGLPRPVRMLPSPTKGTVALARRPQSSPPLSTPEPAPVAPPPIYPASVIVSADVLPRLVPVPPDAPRFVMGQHQITNRQFATFLADPANADWRKGGLKVRGHRDYLKRWPAGDMPAELSAYPVVYVSAAAASAYASWAHDRLRLPTVDEWRTAAHAGRAENDWLDEEIAMDRANFYETDAQIATVGELDSNPYGLSDLVGNVRDMCVTEATDGVAACGGAFTSARPELDALLRMSPRECRPDVGFRLAGAAADAELI